MAAGWGLKALSRSAAICRTQQSHEKLDQGDEERGEPGGASDR
jgi:hypothetical protein